MSDVIPTQNVQILTYLEEITYQMLLRQYLSPIYWLMLTLGYVMY